MNCAPDCLARLSSAVTRSLAGMLIGGAGSAWAWTDIASRQAAAIGRMRIRLDKGPLPDRKSVVEGKRVSVRVDLGGRRIVKQQNITGAHRLYGQRRT